MPTPALIIVSAFGSTGYFLSALQQEAAHCGSRQQRLLPYQRRTLCEYRMYERMEEVANTGQDMTLP
jgi:hypothetical protein